MKSTHTAQIDIPQLPPTATTAHLFPALGNTSLISIGQLCDAGCKVIFTATTAEVWLNGELILTGTRSKLTALWTTTLQPPKPPSPEPTQPSPTPAMALYAQNSATPAERVAFQHACLCSPALSTLKQALKNNYITGFPGLNETSLKKHPPHSTAIFKGHMDQTRKNQRSTKPAATPLPEALPSTNLIEGMGDFFPLRAPPGLDTQH